MHGNCHFGARGLGSHRDFPVLGRMCDGVVQQVTQHLSHSLGVHVNGRQVGRQIDDERQTLDVCLRPQDGDSLFHDACQGHGLTLERELPRLGLRQLLQVGHQPAEKHGFFVKVINQGGIG